MKVVAQSLLLFTLAPISIAWAAEPTHLLLRQDGQAMVTETRAVPLPQGEGTLLLPDLPTSMDPSTLRLRSLSSPSSLLVRGLSTETEGTTPAQLLRNHVGRQVEVLLPEGKGVVRTPAKVLAATQPPLLLIGGAVYAGPVEAIIYPGETTIPSLLPSATALVRNGGAQRQEVEVSYLAREISWRMDYALTLPKASGPGRLEGWAVLENRSGKTYAPAEVELLAGETNAPRQPVGRALMMADAMPKFASIEPQDVAEHHLYRLPRPVDLADGRVLLSPLFQPANVEVSRRLVGTGQALNAGGGSAREPLNVVLSFRNIKAQGLGLALPSGHLRVYENAGGVTRLVGEAQLERSAVGETSEFSVGTAFDVNVERVATSMEKTGKNGWRGAWELRVRNSGRTARRVVLRERIPGAWKIDRATAKWRKASAEILEFELEVPPTGDGDPLTVGYSFTTEL